MESRTFLDRVEMGLRVLLMALLTASAGSIILQVFFRYVLKNALVWSEEAARYSLIWMTMIGAAVAVRRHQHLAIDSIMSKFTQKARRNVEMGMEILTAITSALFVYLGIRMTMVAHNGISPAIKIPMSYVYVALPIGFFFMAIFSIERIVKIIKKQG